MGWDVIEIGLRHDLPIHDPYATAQECSKRLKRNIRLVAEEKYRYVEEDGIASVVSLWGPRVELARYRYDDTDCFLELVVEDYQQRSIIEQVGQKKLKKATYPEGYDAGRFLNIKPYAMYEFLDDEFDVRIFEEVIDISIYGRWSWLEKCLSNHDEDLRNMVLAYRQSVRQRAKLFSCDEVIYCADQGAGEFILENLNLKADELMTYVKGKRYIDDFAKHEEIDVSKYKEDALHVSFSDYEKGELLVKENEWVEVVFDKV